MEFPLESILRLRKQQVTQCEIRLQRAQAELNHWLQREATLSDEIDQLKIPIERELQVITPLLMANEQYAQACHRQMVDARLRQAESRQRLVQVTHDYHRMRTELEKIETLKEEHEQEYRRQLLRYEAHQLSEIPLRDWSTRG